MGRATPRIVAGALVAVAATGMAVLIGLASLAGAVVGQVVPGAPAGNRAAAPGGPAGAGPGDGAAPAVPVEMATLYRQAAATCPGLPWTVLAGIGTVESDNGTSTLPGVHSGANPAGAEGPMQFEPATFAAYDEPVPPDGADPPSPYDPADAVYAAARLLCADGARGGTDLPAAVFAYNHSQTYVSQVFAVAATLGGP